MAERPSGQVAFLFTDLEGSTRFWERAPHLMPRVYALHDEILRSTVAAHQGHVYKVIGDAFQIAFSTPESALRAAVAIQQALLAEPWPVSPAPRVRMALHFTAVVPDADGDYRTPGLNRLGRLLIAADGGQILLTESLATALSKAQYQQSGIDIVDLGANAFRDLTPQHVFQVLAPGLDRQLAKLRALKPHRHNLPQPATSFVGRAHELQTLEALLLGQQSRVLTLLGPGGVGKTRLAIALGRRVVERFADGVWFVPLASLADSELVLSEVANVLGIRESIEQTTLDALIAHFAERECLLVLDNLEHLIAAAPRLAALVAACPRLAMLATSRIALGIAGEQEFPLSPLGTIHTPVQQSAETDEAVQLFVERARAIVPAMRLTTENVAAVSAICRRLDGLPLAIELAAARSRLLPPAKLLARLEARLPLLTGGPRDAPARQQTLHNAIAWSYDLLDAGEKQLFAQLAIFAGGASLEAIAAVCDFPVSSAHSIDALDTIESLARQSLLTLDDAAGDGRIHMLETIREFAHVALTTRGDAPRTAARHAAFYVAFAEVGGAELAGEDQAAWLESISREHDNLRAALSYLESTAQAAALIRLCGALWRFWWIRGHLREGRGWLQKALALADPEPVTDALFARALDGAGVLAEAQGDAASASAHHERALALWQRAGDDLGQARSLQNLGIIALYDRGEVGRARELHEAAMARFQAAGDRAGIASSLKNLGDAALEVEDFAAARRSYARSLVVARELRDTRGIAAGLTSLGVLAFLDGDAQRATEHYEESLPLWRALDDLPDLALVLGNLGEARDRLGESDRAEALYGESLHLCRELGDDQGVAFAQAHLGKLARQRADLVLAARLYSDSAELSRQIGDSARLAESIEGLAGTLADSGEPAAAARLFGYASAIRESTASPLHSVHLPAYERDVATVRGLLGPDAFSNAFSQGALDNLESLPFSSAGSTALHLR